MNVTLRPEKQLLDPSFESYKLSLEKIPIFKVSVQDKISFVKPSAYLSRQHVKEYTSYNCLFLDPFHPGVICYMSSDGSIHRVCVPENPSNFTSAVCAECARVPYSHREIKNPVTLRFPDASIAVLYDGDSSLHIFDTKDACKWEYVRSLEPPLLCCAAELLDALMIRDSNDGIRELHCLFASIGERPEDLLLPHCSKSGYLSYLEWMHYHFEDSTSNWHLARHRRLASSSFPDYVAFERAAQALHICAENSFWPVYDSAYPEVAEQFKKPPVVESPMNTESSKMSLISMTPEIEAASAGSVEWIQTDSVTEEEGFGTISISFRLSASQMPGVDLPTKDAVHILVAPRTPEDNERQTLKIEILNAANVPHTESSQHASERSSVVLFDHFLYGSVQPDPVWTIDRDELLLDVHLTKTCALCWPRLLFNEQMDRSLVKQKTGDPALDTVPNPSGDETSQVAPLNPAFNIEQLEDIDFPMDDENEDLILQRIDGDTLKVTNQSNLLANQWLFNIQTVRNSTYSATGAVCLRQDVDGIVWLPVDLSASDSGPETSTKSPWRHVATLQAFGYVLASKRDHRFVACPLLADGELLSYVAVADCSRHVFIYRQPISGGPFPGCGTELRRRNVGKEKQDDRSAGTVVHVAWQHVINLPEDEQIIGFVALDKPYPACLICTEQTLYLASLVG